MVEIRCWFCGEQTIKGSLDKTEIRRFRTDEHLTPVSRGGEIGGVNRVDACFSCNARKCDRTLEEFREYLFSLTPAGIARKSLLQALGTDAIPEHSSRLLQIIEEIDQRFPRTKFYGEL